MRTLLPLLLILCLACTSNRHTTTKADITTDSHTEAIRRVQAISATENNIRLLSTRHADSITIHIHPGTTTPAADITIHRPRDTTQATQTQTHADHYSQSDSATHHAATTDSTITDSTNANRTLHPPDWLLILIPIIITAITIVWIIRKRRP